MDALLYSERTTNLAENLGLYLADRMGEWIDGPTLQDPRIGGQRYAARVKELRDNGFDIESRPKPGHRSVWEFRLVGESA